VSDTPDFDQDHIEYIMDTRTWAQHPQTHMTVAQYVSETPPETVRAMINVLNDIVRRATERPRIQMASEQDLAHLANKLRQ